MSVLQGIRVIEFATYIAAPAAATVMSDFGAEVIKIERLPGGDPYRYLSVLPLMPVSGKNYCWILTGRNKRSLGLDVAKPEGRETLLKLCESADVFITNMQPSALTKLQLEYEQVAPRNPRLIYAQMTGYGEAGADVERPGYDMTAFWARSGLMDSVYSAAGEPALSVAGQGDHPSSLALLSGILLALYDREKTGRGTKVSSSLIANGVWSNACNAQAALTGAPYLRSSRKTIPNPLINYYQSRDGRRFILCGVQTAVDWPKLCRAVGREEWLAEARFATPEGRGEHAAEIVRQLDGIFPTRDFAEWTRIFHEVQLPWGPVNGNLDLVDDAQLRAAGVFIDGDQGETISSPFWLEGREKARPGRSPEIGEHTRAVLAEAGFSAEEIDRLLAAGVASESAR